MSAEEKTGLRLNELGYVFQDYALLPDLTALENVAVPLMMQGRSKKDAYAKAKLSLERVGLVHRLDNLPSQLSGGEQQRTSIARALAHGPKVLFADAPTANLSYGNATLPRSAQTGANYHHGDARRRIQLTFATHRPTR